jgi:hypothetical protein
LSFKQIIILLYLAFRLNWRGHCAVIYLYYTIPVLTIPIAY